MTAPDFLNSAVVPFYYTQTTGITDVNTIISDVRTVLVTNLSWTEPTTALFQSPSDASGKFLDVLLTRITATNLEVRLRDYRGSALFTRRIQIDATASVNYFGNKYGLVIESLRATPEIFRGGLLDPAPDSLSDVDNRIVGNAYRNNADGIDAAAGEVASLFAFDNGAAGVVSRLIMPWRQTTNTDVSGIDGAATLMYRDSYIRITQASGADRASGRMYQALLCDNSLAFATDKVVPTDDAGATGTFRVIGLTTIVGTRVMYRKA